MERERKRGYLLRNTFSEDEDEEEETMTCMKEECKEERKTF